MDEAVHEPTPVPRRPTAARGLPDPAGPVLRPSAVLWSVLLHGAVIAGVCCGALPGPGRDTVHAVWVEVLQPDTRPPVIEPDLPREEIATAPEVEPPPLPPVEPPDDAPFEEPLWEREPVDPMPVERSTDLLPEACWADVVADTARRAEPAAAESTTEAELPPAVVEAEPLQSENLPPAYPEAALRRGVQGTVVVELSIAADGSVRGARVVESSGSSLLDESARQQLTTWRFEPARRDGVACESTFRQPVVFRITG